MLPTQLNLEWNETDKYNIPDDRSISCNLTCCKYSEDDIICFTDRNYTDNNTLKTLAPWELAVRWTFASLILLLAVFGNMSIIIILTRNRLLLRTSVNHFILNMSVADLILALTGPIPFTLRDTSMFWPLGETWCHLEGYIQMLVMLVSLASITTISCDRMMGIVRPFHTHLKTWQSLAIIFIIWVGSALLALPWSLYRVYTVHIWKDVTEKICGENEKLYTWWMAVVGLTWVPLAIMLISYLNIVFYFKHPSFKYLSRKEHPVLTHLKKRVIKMMFLVAVIFVVCWLPIQLLKILYTSFLDEFGRFKNDLNEKVYTALMTVSQYMIFVNSAVNPIIYGLLHQTFRRAFRLTFPCIFTRKSSLVLTRGQGVTRYVWSVKYTGSRSSFAGTKHRRISEKRCQTSTQELETTITSRWFRGLKKKKGKNQERQQNFTSNTNNIEETKIHVMKSECYTREIYKKEEIWTIENEHDGRLLSTWSSYVNEKFVTELNTKVSIVSKGAMGHLITEVIEEETSSEAEKERVL